MFKLFSQRAKKIRLNAPRLVTATKSVCEMLEGRQLLSTSVTLSSGVLTINGDPTAANTLTAELASGGKTITASAGQHEAMTVALSSVSKIIVNGGAGADYIFVDNGIVLPVVINGGDGNDSIHGSGGNNAIFEGNGGDYIQCRGIAAYVQVGNGNDEVLGSAGNDTILAGNGNDTIDAGNGNDSVTAGNGNDSITGDSGNDTLTAGNGTDYVNGGLGDDNMRVGIGGSVVVPGSGTNYIVLGNPKAIVIPSAGKNTVVDLTGTTISSPTSNVATSVIPTWVTYTGAKPATSTTPQAILQVLEPSAVAGMSVDVRGLNSVLNSGSPIDALYSWNFGDPSGEYNTLTGFNAAHVYTVGGTYTVTLTVENSAYKTSTVSGTITIAADNRKAIYVDSVHGNDANSGASPALAVKTAARADSMVTNNTEVFFDRGEEFNLAAAFLLHHQNILVGAYGTGAQPIINYTAPGSGTVIFSTNSTSSVGVTIQDLTFTTENGTNPSLAGQPMAIMAGGYGTTVLRCTFLYVEYDVNGDPGPVGLTVEDSTSPTTNGLQGYFVWDEGVDTTIIHNTVAGSVHEHVVRTSSATEMLIYDNNFSNNDGKGCIEIHNGADAWIQDNTATGGDIRVGPLGLWGEPITSATNDCVITGNTVINNEIAVYPGAHDISIRNNIIKTNIGQMIDVKGQDGLGRQSADIRILDNTGISTGTTGNFLKVENHTNGITLENNLLVQPLLAVGGYNAAPVFVVEASLASFSYINGNVWQFSDHAYGYAQGGDNFFGLTYTSSGYQTAAEWNSQVQVGTDYFVDTTLNSSLAPVAGSVAAKAASSIPGIFVDYNGKIRSQSGSWAAGALQP